MHTLFSVAEQRVQDEDRQQDCAALHELYFHPEAGLLAWLLHLRPGARLAG